MKGAKKKMARLAAIIALAVVPLLLVSVTKAASGSASSVLGTVKEIKNGRIERQQNGVWKALGIGGKLFAYDKVRTDSSGMAVLHLDGIGNFLIGPHTEYTLGDNPLNFKTILHRGFVWFKSQLPAGALMDISASNAVAGVRGTRFSVLADNQGVDFCTCEGSVAVTTAAGKIVSVGSGMSSTVRKDGAASTPGKGKALLAKQWRKETARYASCTHCHSKGKKPRDLL